MEWNRFLFGILLGGTIFVEFSEVCRLMVRKGMSHEGGPEKIFGSKETIWG